MAGPSLEERQSVRGYIIAQAAKLAIPDLVAKVRTDSATLREVAAAVPAERWHDKPRDGDWSAAEVCSHILEMNAHGADNIEAILDGRPLPERVEDLIREDTGEAPPDAATFWEQFTARRERLYERVAKANGDEHFEVKLNHTWFGDLTWREWFLFMRVHDLDHLRQIQAVTAALAG